MAFDKEQVRKLKISTFNKVCEFNALILDSQDHQISAAKGLNLHVPPQIR